MLELRSYSKLEIAQILGTRGRQGICRKLQRYNVEYVVTGRGDNAVFTIKEINDKFKLFCIIDMHIHAQTDLKSFRNFLYYFFCDDNFRELPDETKEFFLDEKEKHISRQTLANYTRILERLNLVSTLGGEYIYYFAIKRNQRRVEKEEYNKAWREYFQDRRNGLESWEAINNMCWNYGGVARKYRVPEINAIEASFINQIVELVCENIENEVPEEVLSQTINS